MPLKAGIGNIGNNIREMQAAGHPHAQAVAAALRTAYGPPKRASGGVVGALTGSTPGRADKLPIGVPNGSYVLPADVVSALGGGNSQHGHAALSRMFPGSRKQRKSPRPHMTLADGGEATVPIMASDGEFVISPEDVARVGHGDEKKGHARLDAFTLHVRKNNIAKLQSLPGPAK